MPDHPMRRIFRRLSQSLYLDLGPPEATTFIAGMGRSGTTWVGAIVNHDFNYRILFEPFRPHHVPATEVFGPFAYVRPTDRDPSRTAAAITILSGRTPRGTVDRENHGRIFRRRIVKEVRCNLMLAWLKELRPAMPLVLVVRNPFAVAASWLRLGWGQVAGGERSELDVILDQVALLDDFPLIRETLPDLDRSDAFERVLFQWCILHLVPFRQLRAGEAHPLFYEDLVREPAGTVRRLNEYLHVRIEGPSLHRALVANTETDFLGRGSDADRQKLLHEWRTVLSRSQIERGREILRAFGLDQLYDETGSPLPDDFTMGLADQQR
jgi:hypothetical protein